MSKEFIEQGIGSASIAEARKQQEELSYFTQSSIQQDVTVSYLDAWADKKYRTDDRFLNWVKTVFKTDNFLSFFKYFRQPIASSRLVNDRIKTPLGRVFFSEDAFFKYTIGGKEVEEPDELEVTDFNEWMFNALLFRHNDILITDLQDTNKPFRQLISIENVVAIDSQRSVIHRLAFRATAVIADEMGIDNVVNGFLYMDDFDYIFYDPDLKPLLIVPHDLEECPADYVSRQPFKDDDVVRKSIFSYAREELEEYVFLKTLQRMTEPNGAIPIVTKLKTTTKNNNDKKGETDKEPLNPSEIISRVEL